MRSNIRIPLPRGWPRAIRSAVIHAISLAQFSLTHTRSWAVLDRDSEYSSAFQGLLKGSGITVVRLPPRSPNLNAYAERFVRTIKDECLYRLIFFNERSLWYAVDEFAEHYHHERPHQGLGNRTIELPGTALPPAESAICRERLGGLLCSYERHAA